jgi:hypothetical protein
MAQSRAVSPPRSLVTLIVVPLGAPLHAIITNVPAGLTAVLTRTSSTVATLTLTGNAAAHSNLADVANIGIAWQDGAFTNTTLATNVTNNAYTTGAIDFVNQASIIPAGNFSETLANGGAVSGSRTMTISGDTYTAGVAVLGTFTPGVHYTVNNLPAGFTEVVTKTSASVATITLHWFSNTSCKHKRRCELRHYIPRRCVCKHHTCSQCHRLLRCNWCDRLR